MISAIGHTLTVRASSTFGGKEDETGSARSSSIRRDPPIDLIPHLPGLWELVSKKSNGFGAPTLPATVLYDQYDNFAGPDPINGGVSLSTTQTGTETGDDFVVPLGRSWVVDKVDFRGVATEPLSGSVNIRFYTTYHNTNLGDFPYTLAYEALNVTVTGTDPDFSAVLATPAVLRPGRYWLSVQQADGSNSWGWAMRTVQNNERARVKRVTCPFTTYDLPWKDRPSCTSSANAPDQVFRIHGSLQAGDFVPPPNYYFINPYPSRINILPAGSSTYTSVPTFFGASGLAVTHKLFVDQVTDTYSEDYSLTGVPLNNSSFGPGLARDLRDGATDGVQYNYAVTCCENVSQVFRTDLNWRNATGLFYVGGDNYGITYDTTTGHLFITSHDGRGPGSSTLKEYSLTGDLLFSVDLNDPVAYRGLAYNQFTDTLFTKKSTATGITLLEWSKTGVLLSTTDIAGPDDGGGISGEFQILVPPVGPDITPPDTTIDGTPRNLTNLTAGSFTFNGLDAVTQAGNFTFDCQLDAEPFAACQSPKAYAGLSVGEHTFKVRARDIAGNLDATPASFTWKIDTTPSEAVLYDQYDHFAPVRFTLGGGGSESNVPSGTETADDFLVPIGRSWVIEKIDFRGDGNPGPVNVRIYRDYDEGVIDTHIPDTQLYEALNLAPIGNSPDQSVSLQTPLVLPPGTYWISVQATNSYWSWQMRSEQTVRGAATRRPGTCPSGIQALGYWRDRGLCNVNLDAPDQLFRIIGSKSQNGTGSPPDYYFTNGSGKMFILPTGSSTYTSVPTYHEAYAIAVNDKVVLNNYHSTDVRDYSFAGVPLGNRYDGRSFQSSLVDGTTDGVAYNYGITGGAYYESSTVYRTDLNWENPSTTFLFGAPGGSIGITYDTSTGHLFVINFLGNFQPGLTSLLEYDLNGDLISRVVLPIVEARYGLAYNQFSDTLFTRDKVGATATLYEWSKSGVLLSVNPINGPDPGIGPLGGEFRIRASSVPPTITTTAAPSAIEDTLYTYNAAATSGTRPDQIWSLTGTHTCGGSIDPATGVFAFTPEGPVPAASCTIAIQVSDGGTPNLSDTQSTIVTITAVNDAPVFDTLAPTTATEDTQYTYNAAVSDADGPGQNWSFSNLHTCGGSLSPSTGVFTFLPVGPVPVASCVLSVQVSDGGTPALSITQTTTVTISSVNDAPVINTTPPATATEDVVYSYTPTRTDPDGPGQSWSLVPVTHTCAGSINPGTGVFTFTPTGPVPPASCVVAIRVTDGGTPNLSATQSTTVTITAVNNAPVINSSASTTATEDTLYTYNATRSDSDGPGQTWSLLGSHTCGGSINPLTGVFTFTPLGPVPAASCVLAVQVADGGTPSLANSQSTTITITAVNDAPVINGSASTTATEDTLYTYSPTRSDPDGPGQTWSLLGSHTCGGSIDPSTGVFTFTPLGPVPSASCVVAVQVTDGGTPNLSATQSTNVTIAAVNDAPVISSSASITATEDTLYTYNATRSDLDGPGQTWSLLAGHTCGGSINPSSGVFTFTPLGPVPPAGCVLAVQVTDGGSPSLSSSQSTAVTITAVNDAPTAVNQSVTTDEDIAKAIVLSGSDPDSATLTYSAVQPGHGLLSCTGANCTYTPAANYNGPDSFTFTANDGLLVSAAATISISVTPVNDPPTANAQSATTNEDTSKAITLSGGDPDDPTTPITYAIVGLPAHGTLSGTGANRTYTPAANYFGPDSFTFRVNDGVLDSSAATVSITVTPVNDAPTAANDSAVTDEDTAISIDARGNDSDVDGDTVVITSVGNGIIGTTAITATGRILYTPNPNIYGPDSFTYTISDGHGGTASATVSVTINSVNDLPAVSNNRSSQAVQYSDPIQSVIVTASDIETPASSLIAASRFSTDGGAHWQTGLPAGLTFASWNISGAANVPAGTYLIQVNATDANQGSGSTSFTIVVGRETAVSDYTGDLDLMTAGPAVTSATVRLAAKLTQDPDNALGDLTKATVTFKVYKFSATTPSFTISNVPVDANGDAQITYTLPADVYTVRVEVDGTNGYWIADPIDGMLNITVPTNELRSSGGGWVPDATSSNGRAHLAFSVSVSKNGQPKGNLSFSYRGTDGFTYLVKSNSWNDGYLQFAAEPNVSPAVYTRSSLKGSCTLQKIDRTTGLVVASFGGHTFEVLTKDGDLLRPSQNDGYSIIVRNNTNAVIHQVGSKTELITLGGGNVANKAK